MQQRFTAPRADGRIDTLFIESPIAVKQKMMEWPEVQELISEGMFVEVAGAQERYVSLL